MHIGDNSRGWQFATAGCFVARSSRRLSNRLSTRDNTLHTERKIGAWIRRNLSWHVFIYIVYINYNDTTISRWFFTEISVAIITLRIWTIVYIHIEVWDVNIHKAHIWNPVKVTAWMHDYIPYIPIHPLSRSEMVYNVGHGWDVRHILCFGHWLANVLNISAVYTRDDP